MQRPDEAKRRLIMESAAELFATRPFHEVRLDDVAAKAQVGKGTVYVYFKSKDDLYVSLIVEGFEQLLQRLRPRVEADDGSSAWDTLSVIVREQVAWAKRFPHFFQLMRPGHLAPPPELREKRRELGKLIERVIVRGVKRGELNDPRPELTAQFIPSFVRGALKFGPSDVGAETLSNHILRLLAHGIRKEGK